MKNRKCDRRFGAHAVCSCKHVIGSHAAGALGTSAGGRCLHRYCECRRFVPVCAVCKRRPAVLPSSYGFEPITAPVCEGCAAAFHKPAPAAACSCRPGCDRWLPCGCVCHEATL